jgi:hypothetical protein
MKPKVKTKLVTGRKPERLKFHGNWKSAIKKSLQKKKPVGGWPKIGGAF